MMRKRLASLVAIALVVAACGSNGDADTSTTATTEPPQESTTTESMEEPTSTTAAEPTTPEVCRGQDGTGLKVGFANLSENAPFAVIVREGIQSVAEECGVELVVADNDRDPVKVVENAENFVAQEVDGVIEFSNLRDLSQSICDIFGDRPVLAIDIPVEPCGVFMGADNRAAGEIGGAGAGELVNELWNCDVDAIVTLENFSIGEINTNRMNGQLAGLQSICPDLQLGDFEEWTPAIEDSIVTRLEAFEIETGFAQGRDYLTAHPDAETIVALCLNDEGCLGLKSAVEESGRVGQVIFASQGANTVSHEFIRNDPYWAGGTAYLPEKYGELLIPNIIRMINGEPPEAEPLLMEHVFINVDNIDEYYPES